MKANSLDELVTNSNIAGELRNYTDWHTRLVKFAQLVADWQAEKCDEETSKLLYAERQTAYINGWDDHKGQMLKDASEIQIVEDGRIELEGNPLPCLNPIILLPYPQFEPGDKVRIVVLKEEE